jgi:hypothetical protein
MDFLVRFKSTEDLETAEREMWARYRAEKVRAHGLSTPWFDRTVDGRPAPAQITERLVETFTAPDTEGGLMLLDITGRTYLPAKAEKNMLEFGPDQLEGRYAAIYAEVTKPRLIPDPKSELAEAVAVEASLSEIFGGKDVG